MQEDLRVLINGILDKQKKHAKRGTRKDMYVIPEFESSKSNIQAKSTFSSEETKNNNVSRRLDLKKGSQFQRLSKGKNASIASVGPSPSFRAKDERKGSFVSRRQSFNEKNEEEWSSDEYVFLN